MLYETEERRIMGEKEWLESIGYHKGIAIHILEFFEDMLEEKNITIPDNDRADDPTEARLYGLTYANLEDQITALLEKYFPGNFSVREFDIAAFLEKFNREYQFLYDNHDSVAGFLDALETGNQFMYDHPDFIAEFIRFRGEPITSDREVAAFMFALESMSE